MQRKLVNRGDLVKSFPMAMYCVLTKIGFDTDENEPRNVWRRFNLSFHSLLVPRAREPPRMAAEPSAPMQ